MMSEKEVNHRLKRAEAWALSGKQRAAGAQTLLRCAKKRALLRQAEESFRAAAEELSFVKDMG